MGLGAAGAGFRRTGGWGIGPAGRPAGGVRTGTPDLPEGEAGVVGDGIAGRAGAEGLAGKAGAGPPARPENPETGAVGRLPGETWGRAAADARSFRNCFKLKSAGKGLPWGKVSFWEKAEPGSCFR